MSSVEAPWPDDENRPRRDNDDHALQGPPRQESIPELDKQIELPIAAEEISPLAGQLEEFESSQADLLGVISEEFAGASEDRYATLMAAKAAYISAYSGLIGELVVTYNTDIDELVRATANITSEDIERRYKTFATLSPKFDISHKPTHTSLTLWHKAEADEHLYESTQLSPAAFINCLTNGFLTDVEDTLQQIVSFLPDKPDQESKEEIQSSPRARLIASLGIAAGKALTIAAGVAAGMIIADRLKKR